MTVQSGWLLGISFCRWWVDSSHAARTGHAHHEPDCSNTLVSPLPLWSVLLPRNVTHTDVASYSWCA
ncbi:hypothetical protein PF005_g20802 [Phytophthora fragariae]|uniref:Secreted protein n=2 Tax=Phytophthora TaxID=4783 RepID=A0A6A4BSW8_9STRA|nr:hypothetical protein PF003_g9171 [Phytophthora fragariae]KAE8965401.1 hypothetical protein PR001_g28747 [Phytophthora rubi]KAE8928840.1 hypothetical protein PF009_g21027 [Phytophthora fragariae]KAE8966231.1 hypothetical protein PR002_g28426 [Phytophthora rubi]KAE9078713.1 hypothetical protein PF006_g27662 [Phytophthora fragariae]